MHLRVGRGCATLNCSSSTPCPLFRQPNGCASTTMTPRARRDATTLLTLFLQMHLPSVPEELDTPARGLRREREGGGVRGEGKREKERSCSATCWLRAVRRGKSPGRTTKRRRAPALEIGWPVGCFNLDVVGQVNKCPRKGGAIGDRQPRIGKHPFHCNLAWNDRSHIRRSQTVHNISSMYEPPHTLPTW